MRSVRYLSLLVIGTLICLAGVACNNPFLRNAHMERTQSEEIEAQVRNQLRIGMDRSEVESLVHEHAWKHYRCPVVDGSIDI
jgi:hypothetical protein